MNTIKRALKRVLRSPANALTASSTRLPSLIDDRIGPALSSDLRVQKYYPHAPGQDSYLIPKPDGGETMGRDAAGLPIPTKEFWVNYGDTVEWYLESGRATNERMREITNTDGFRLEDAGRILDFGCAAGRMIRWLSDLTSRAEVWGVDISATHIVWCRQHLSPPFRFATVTTAPHLPFEDGSFGFVFAGSVFTHIEDMAEAWLLELRRITRPGGRLYLTVHDRHTLELLTDPKHADKLYPTGRRGGNVLVKRMLKEYEAKTSFSRANFESFTMGRGPDSQVFYDNDYLREHWGRFLRVLSVTPEAYGYQTAVLLEKNPAS